jgi:hypothetical protein
METHELQAGTILLNSRQRGYTISHWLSVESGGAAAPPYLGGDALLRVQVITACQWEILLPYSYYSPDHRAGVGSGSRGRSTHLF